MYSVVTLQDGGWSGERLETRGGGSEVSFTGLNLIAEPHGDIAARADKIDRVLRHLSDGVLTFTLLEAAFTAWGIEEQIASAPRDDGWANITPRILEDALGRMFERTAHTTAR